MFQPREIPYLIHGVFPPLICLWELISSYAAERLNGIDIDILLGETLFVTQPIFIIQRFFHVKYIINHYRRVKQEGWRLACASSNRRRLGIRGMLFELSNRRSLDTVIPCVLSNRILYESSNRKSSTAMPYESSNMNRKKLEVNLSTSPHCCHNSLKRLTRFVILVSLSPKPCSDPNSKT